MVAEIKIQPLVFLIRKTKGCCMVIHKSLSVFLQHLEEFVARECRCSGVQAECFV